MLATRRATPSSSNIGKNRAAWWRRDPAPEAAAPGAGLRPGEHDATGDDVRITADVIGVGVVAVVLLDPPAVAQPDQQVRAHQAQQVVVAPGTEHLPMACVVAEEAELDEHDRQERRDHQLPPRRPEQGEHRPPHRKQRHGEGDPGTVVAGAPIQQPGRTHQPGQLGVVTAPADERTDQVRRASPHRHGLRASPRSRSDRASVNRRSLSRIVHVTTRPALTVNGVAKGRSDSLAHCQFGWQLSTVPRLGGCPVAEPART